MPSQENTNPPETPARTQRFKTADLAITTAALGFLVAVNTSIIFRQGWIFSGFPHNYLFSALQTYLDEVRCFESGCNTAWPISLLENLDSPLYWISTWLGQIGQPTPPWFRLTGVVVLVLTFLAAYFLRPSPVSPTDRLVTALTLCTAPVVLTICRYHEDYGFQILLLVVGAGSLLHSRMGRDTLKAIPFYLVPALFFFTTRTTTMFLIACMCLFGMYVYTVADRLRDRSVAILSFVKIESIRIALVALSMILVVWLRTQAGFEAHFLYFLDETIRIEAAKASWLKYLTAYPRYLIFGGAGVMICLVAAMNAFKRFRGGAFGLFLLWMVVPLIFLSAMTKRNIHYAWFLVPALALLAAGAVSRFPLFWKRLWLVFCLGGAAFHIINVISPLYLLADYQQFELGMNLENNEQFLHYNHRTKQENLQEAGKVLELAQVCGPLEDMVLVVYYECETHPDGLYFSMLHLNPEPTYWFLEFVLDLPYPAVVVRIRDLDGISNDFCSTWDDQFKQTIAMLTEVAVADHALVFASEKYRLYCPKTKTYKMKPLP